jgi:hypothetical protein
MEDPKVITLAGLADGAALELWQAALERVLQNIEDPNTDTKTKRAIRLDVVFSVADEERRVGDCEVRCSTKLAGVKGVKTLVYIGRHQGALVAVEQPRQQDLFPAPGGELKSIAGGKASA